MVKSAISEERDRNPKQVSQKFDVYFKKKVVREKLRYLDPDKKHLGYEIIEGRSKGSSSMVNLSNGRDKKRIDRCGQE